MTVAEAAAVIAIAGERYVAPSSYDYKPRPISYERRDEIVSIAESLRYDAAHDIEDKRDIYEALMDLLDVASRGVCVEHRELSR